MNLLEIRDNVKYLLDEDGVYRDNDILDATINEGYVVLAAVTQCIERTYSFEVHAGAHFAELNARTLAPVAIYVANERLYPTRIGSFNMLSSTWMTDAPDIPTHYALTNLMTSVPKMWLYPRPNVNMMIKISAAELPEHPLTKDIDVPLIPPEHRYALVVWALLWELFKERANIIANKVFRYATEFAERANDLRQYMYRRTPNRDWQTATLEAEAVRAKMHDVFRASQSGSMDQTTAKDLSA
jgi:hypothetical protein